MGLVYDIGVCDNIIMSRSTTTASTDDGGVAMAKDPTGTPTDDEILRLLRQDAKRKEYMQSPKAKANRTTYQDKRKAEAKAMREYLVKHPELREKFLAENPDLAILQPKS